MVAQRLSIIDVATRQGAGIPGRITAPVGKMGCSRRIRSMDESGLKGFWRKRRGLLCWDHAAEQLCTISFAAIRRSVRADGKSAMPFAGIDELPEAATVDVLTPPGLYGRRVYCCRDAQIRICTKKAARRNVFITRRVGAGIETRSQGRGTSQPTEAAI